MTDWNKLWNREIKEGDTDWKVTKNWLYEVKAEGDKLKEKAETLDTILVGKSLDEYVSLIDGFQVKSEKYDAIVLHYQTYKTLEGIAKGVIDAFSPRG